MRGIEERLAWYAKNRPAAANRCAEYLWHALGGPTDPPRQGLPDATAVFKAVPKGKINAGPAPRGAIVYWTGGANGHGHCAFALGDRREISVDVDGPRTVGIKPFTWFAKNWPSLQYQGWSWYWGAFDTEPKKPEPKPEPPASAFPVGHTELVSRKAADGNALTLTVGDWATVASIDIPAPGHYLNTMQTRLPGGLWAEARMVRIGWGTDPDGRDQTGLRIIHARPDGRDTSDSYTHPIKGGGPLAFRLKLHGAPEGTEVEVPTIICKSFRDY